MFSQVSVPNPSLQADPQESQSFGYAPTCSTSRTPDPHQNTARCEWWCLSSWERLGNQSLCCISTTQMLFKIHIDTSTPISCSHSTQSTISMWFVDYWKVYVLLSIIHVRIQPMPIYCSILCKLQNTPKVIFEQWWKGLLSIIIIASLIPGVGMVSLLKKVQLEGTNSGRVNSEVVATVERSRFHLYCITAFP